MTNALRSLAKHVVDPVLYRVDPHYVFHRARRDWDRRAQVVPKETTGQALGVDISPAMIKQARARAASPTSRYEPVGADQQLPLPDGAADLIIAWTVFRHVSKSVFAHYLDESHRVLRPTGCLVFEAQVRETGTNGEPPPYDSLTEREYSRAELARYCTGHGFRWSAERTTASVAPGTVTRTMAWRSGQP
jgi:SAM-dependent methyltransferase